MIRRSAIFGLFAAVALSMAPTVSAASDFPPGYTGYHTYDEVEARLSAVAGKYPSIVRRKVIGKSFEGRNISVLKISDRPGRDENEPEVLHECNMHAREHITTEMCLYVIDLLTTKYGKSGDLARRITRLVRTREIWIIPMLNPDGSEYDHLDGEWRGWRKNRQAFSGTDKIGIDLNRNWSYQWGCCGGSSGNPGSARYRGQFPFQADENEVLRDFILGRRVAGRQQITSVFNWHSTGEFVMWPYGFTKEDVPPQMTADDHATFVAIGQHMASLNGYKPRQGSDSYIYDGDFPAWGYGDQRMFVYTFEMYPSYSCSGCGGFHPPDSVLARETSRNRDAVLYFTELADCPYRAVNALATINCGPLYDDFEVGRGWTIDASGTDGATSGVLERGNPTATSDATGAKQLSSVSSGMAALVTGAADGGGANANDVDGGITSARSPALRLGGGAWTLEFAYTFAHSASATSADFVRVSVVDGSSVTPVWRVAGDGTNSNGSWGTATVNLNAWAGRKIRLLVEVRDGAADSLIEAALDDIRVYRTH